MKIRILGPRLLVRTYKMPEQTDSGLIIPEAYRALFDGYHFEVVAVGEKVAERLCVAADLGDRVSVCLSGEFEALPLVLQADDIIKVRDANPVYSPEMTAVYGFSCWFLDAVATVQGRERSVIVECWPKSRWAEEAA